MTDAYGKIVADNLRRFFRSVASGEHAGPPVAGDGENWHFSAFGRSCRVEPAGIFLDGRPETGVVGILISLYLLHAVDRPLVLEPLKAFKEFSGSMPYEGAFNTHTQQILAPHVAGIREARSAILAALAGEDAPKGVGGDFAFMVKPLPRIRLCYIFYEADEDFPASATCLYSGNADRYLPIDALADTGEYTSRRLIELAALPRERP